MNPFIPKDLEHLDSLKTLVAMLRAWFGSTEVVIAGGAPRDMLSGVPIKDIDIFVPVPLEKGDDTQFARGCKALAAAYGATPVFQPVSEEYPDCYGICDIETDRGVMQVVGLDRPPLDDLHSYDFGLSQVAITPAGLLFTEAAISDRLNKTITYVARGADDLAIERSRKRLGRLRAKYPGWTFVNCEGLEASLS